MRSTLKPALRLIALCAAAGGSVWVATRAADLIETYNRNAIAQTVLEAGFNWVIVDTDGLTATLSGTAPDEASRFRALRAASDQINPAHLRDAMTVLPPENLPAPEFRLELLRAGDKITSIGLLPGGAEAPGRLAAQLSEVAGALDLSSLVTASAEPVPEGWDTNVQQALAALEALQDARIVLGQTTLSVTGLAPDRSTATTLSEQLRAAVSPGTALTLDLAVPRPVLSPFVTRFRLDAGQAAFDACAAGTPDGLAKIEAAAVAAGMARDKAVCVLAHGAPDSGWDRVAANAITALHGLGSGTVTLADMTLTLVPGENAAPFAIEAALSRIETDLPAGYRVNLPVAVPGGSADLSAPVAVPTFTATRSPEGLLQVRGPLPHAQGDALVENYLSARFDPDGLTVSLRRRGDLPDGWTLRVLAGLDAFSALDTGRLSVTPAMLMLSGVTGQPGLSSDLAAGLTAALGPSEPFQLDISYREELDPVAALPTAEECLDAIKTIQSRDKITFAPGSVELDGPALSIVRRIANVLRDCDGVAMEISGYTDSQGRAEMNQSLSQARADAVFNALMAERVLVGSLTAKGYGEEKPVADNATEEGREANRRIDFTLRYPLQGPPAPDAPHDARADTDETPTESDTNGPD
jgi:OOP family OmpA-OmpF porin